SSTTPASSWSATPPSCPRSTPAGCSATSLRHPDAVLADNRRQQADWERDTLAALRAGSTGPALGAYL
ncbi:MAG: hypothetical protein WCA29_00995, partial [Jiangellales bacterium]